MILIPEQVKELREKIIDLEEKIKDYENYFLECDKSTLESGFVKYKDNTLEVDNYNLDKKILASYIDALNNGEFITDIDYNSIGYGTKFKVKYDEDDEYETYTLTENSLGLKSVNFNRNNGYISVDGLLGKNIKGKKEGDEFRYIVSLKGKKENIVITGKIIEILKKSKNDVNFIMAKPKSFRIASKAKKYRQTLDEKALKELDQITPSQYELLEEEKNRLVNSLMKFKKYQNRIMVNSVVSLKNRKGVVNKYKIVDEDDVDFTREIDCNSIVARRLFSKRKGDYFDERISYKIDGKRKYNYYRGYIVEIDNSLVSKEESVYSNIRTIYSRLGFVNKLLKESSIVKAPNSDIVGIGSKVSIMTFENGEIHNRRVEVINHAVSTELTSDYIEAISPMGEAVIGLKNNQDFVYYSHLGELSSGIVYDINNNMDQKKVKDPLEYQKRKKRVLSK